MKTVFNNRQLAHVWAQQSQPRGRGSNFYFEGATIYSYGGHFPIARFTDRTDSNGARVVLFTNRGYSMSTARHISMTRGALSGLNVRTFGVHDPSREPDAVSLADYRAEYESKLSRALRSRKYAAELVEDANRIASNARALADIYGLPAPNLPEMSAEDKAAIRARVAAFEAAEAARTAAEREERARRDAERAAAEAKARDEWRAGENARYFAEPTMLRLSADRETIETSRGASVPADIAPLVWRLVRNARAESVAINFDAPHRPTLGAFTLDKVTATGDVIAGCHRLPFDELQRMAVALGLN